MSEEAQLDGNACNRGRRRLRDPIFEIVSALKVRLKPVIDVIEPELFMQGISFLLPIAGLSGPRAGP